MSTGSLSSGPLLEALVVPGALRVVFQPVFELAGPRARVHYLEALVRGPADTSLASAAVLFEYARRKGRECTLDVLCVNEILSGTRDLPQGVRLAINVHASTFDREPAFPEMVLGAVARAGLAPTQLVLEIVEHAPAWGGPRFLGALGTLRRAGVAIALDDIGLGQSNFRMMLECHPDYFKIDRFLVQGCADDPRRLAILESLLHLAHRFGSRAVAEGVETTAEMGALRSLGFDLVQGYLLARPGAEAAVAALEPHVP